MKRKTYPIQSASIPNARYRRRHLDKAKIQPREVIAKQKNEVFLDRKSRE